MHVTHTSSENIILKLERVYRLIDEWKQSSHNLDASEKYRIQNLIDIQKREIEKNVSAFKNSCASNFDDIRHLIDRQLREILSYLEPVHARQLTV